jgi:two-component system, cell cycle response regulator
VTEVDQVPGRILLVDDNRDDLELMAYLLRALGHRPLTVDGGAPAMGVARHVKIDLVVSDLSMQRASGFEVAQFFKGDPELKHIPLVAVSAQYGGQARQMALAAGFDAFISKPFTPETFAAQVTHFLGARPSPPVPPRAWAVSSQPVDEPLTIHKRQGTILAVDDKLVNLDLSRSMLEPFGYTVVTAGGVQEALARLRGISVDLVLTDVHMADGTGFDLLRAMKADPKLQRIFCLVISATYLDIDPRAQELGVDDTNFILRPIEPLALVAKIESLRERERT